LSCGFQVRNGLSNVFSESWRKNEDIMNGAGALNKQEVGKVLSKALKVSLLALELIV
jgi:hypothetical protein